MDFLRTNAYESLIPQRARRLARERKKSWKYYENCMRDVLWKRKIFEWRIIWDINLDLPGRSVLLGDSFIEFGLVNKVWMSSGPFRNINKSISGFTWPKSSKSLSCPLMDGRASTPLPKGATITFDCFANQAALLPVAVATCRLVFPEIKGDIFQLPSSVQ